MKNVIRVALVDPNDASRNALKTLLLGMDMVWLDAECHRYEFFIDVVSKSLPDLALISLDANATKGVELITRVTQECPGTYVVALSSSQEGSLILQAMRNGAKEFLPLPLKLEDFLSAVERIRSTGSGKEDGGVRSSQIISVTGVSGGVGCTSLAVNLGCCLAQHPNRSVAILDLDLALGDADVWLDLIPDYTIQDVAENVSRLDYSLLKRSLTKHDCGVYLLPRPVELEERLPLPPEEMKRVLALLKATFTNLVIDTSKSFGPLDIAAMTASDIILLVTQLDLPSLRNAVRMIQFFERQEGLVDKVRVVVNRLGLDDNQISLTKALETLGREVYAQIPNDYGTMVEARNNGIPLILQAPKSRLTRSVQQLAQLLDSSGQTDGPADAKKARKGLFSFLSKGQ